jgi:hypothetical protein
MRKPEHRKIKELVSNDTFQVIGGSLDPERLNIILKLTSVNWAI